MNFSGNNTAITANGTAIPTTDITTSRISLVRFMHMWTMQGLYVRLRNQRADEEARRRAASTLAGKHRAAMAQ